MRPEKFNGGIHPIAITSKSNVYDRQIRTLCFGLLKGFFACGQHPDNIETGLGKGRLYLARDQQIVLNDEYSM